MPRRNAEPGRPATGKASGRGPDAASLVAGAVLVAFGAVLLADALGAFSLRFAALAPIACAAVGAVLLALGLSRED